MEKWKDIEGFEGYYQVSTLGRVKSLSRTSIRRGRIYPQKESVLKMQVTQYPSVMLQKDGKKRRINIHRLVASAFIHNPQNKPMVNHINGIKTDNRVENLEWVTQRENEDHSIKYGLKHIPSNTKLSFGDVKRIRAAVSKGEQQKDIAQKFNVHPTTVSKIVTGSSW